MLYRVLQDKFTRQPNFLEDQYILQKIVLQKVTSVCHRHTSEQQYDNCVEKYRQHQRQFKQFYNSLLDLRQKQLGQYVQDTCMKSSTMDELKKCIELSEQKWIEKYYGRDCNLVMQLRKKQIEQLIAMNEL